MTIPSDGNNPSLVYAKNVLMKYIKWYFSIMLQHIYRKASLIHDSSSLRLIYKDKLTSLKIKSSDLRLLTTKEQTRTIIILLKNRKDRRRKATLTVSKKTILAMNWFKINSTMPE